MMIDGPNTNTKRNSVDINPSSFLSFACYSIIKKQVLFDQKKIFDSLVGCLNGKKTVSFVSPNFTWVFLQVLQMTQTCSKCISSTVYQNLQEEGCQQSFLSMLRERWLYVLTVRTMVYLVPVTLTSPSLSSYLKKNSKSNLS